MRRAGFVPVNAQAASSAALAGSRPAPATTPARIAGPFRRGGVIWPLVLYLLLALVLFGLPVIGHLGSRIIAADELDSSEFIWSLAWWPHALLHGLGPFVTHAVFMPEGFNLTWATSIPGPSILLSPITLAFGPVVSWNVLQLLTPALNAWAAFLLCRHVTRRLGPSLLGGYVYGFSPYVLLHMTGGPNAGFVPLIPVFVLLVIRRVEGTLSSRRFVILMTSALVGQYLVSTEEVVTSMLVGAFGLLAAYVIYADRRRELRELGRLIGLSALATIVVVSPFLYYFFFGQQYPPGATAFRAPLAGFVFPAPLLASTHVLGLGAIRGANTQTYLGLPLLVLLVLAGWQDRRSRLTRLASWCLLVAAIASLGSHLILRGQTSIAAPADQGTVWLPWDLVSPLPVLRYVTPVRLGLFVALAAAVLVAGWLARGGVARWALALLVVASFLPDLGNAAWHTNIADPAFFQAGTYRAYLHREDRVLTVPAWGPNERWQADTNFAFKLAGGYLSNPFPPSYARYPTWTTLLTGRLTADSALQLRRFVADKGVTAIVVDLRYPGPWRALFASLRVRPLHLGGVLLYRLRPPAHGHVGRGAAM